MATSAQEWASGRMKRPRLQQSAFAFLGESQERGALFDFEPVDADGLHDAIASWVNQGYAISFGRTSDGGACGVHLHANGDKKSFYFGTVAELEDFLSRVRAPGGGQTG